MHLILSSPVRASSPLAVSRDILISHAFHLLPDAQQADLPILLPSELPPGKQLLQALRRIPSMLILLLYQQCHRIKSARPRHHAAHHARHLRTRIQQLRLRRRLDWHARPLRHLPNQRADPRERVPKRRPIGLLATRRRRRRRLRLGDPTQRRRQLPVRRIQLAPDALRHLRLARPPREHLLDHARGRGPRVDVGEDDAQGGRHAHRVPPDRDVPRRAVDERRERGREPGAAGLRLRGEQGGREAPVHVAAVDGGRDVEARADFALRGAVGGLREVVQDAEGGFALGGAGGEGEGRDGKIVGQQRGGDGGDERRGGPEARLVGLGDGRREGVEAGGSGGGRAGGRRRRVVVVVREDRDRGRWARERVRGVVPAAAPVAGRDVAQHVGQGRLDEGVAVAHAVGAAVRTMVSIENRIGAKLRNIEIVTIKADRSGSTITRGRKETHPCSCVTKHPPSACVAAR